MTAPAGERAVRALLWAVLLAWLVVTLFPLYWQLITALKTTEETNRTIPTFWPEELRFGNFAAVFTEASNFDALVSSFIIASGNTLLSLLLGTMAGYAFARFPRHAGGENLAFWILSNRMFPPVAVIIPMFFLFDATPWGTDSHISLIILYLVFNMPLATWLMMVFFRDAPRELEEAAYLDGYTPLQAFRKVTLPLVIPGMISVAMLCWIFAWNEYLFGAHVHRRDPDFHPRQPDPVEPADGVLADRGHSAGRAVHRAAALHGARPVARRGQGLREPCRSCASTNCAGAGSSRSSTRSRWR